MGDVLAAALPPDAHPLADAVDGVVLFFLVVDPRRVKPQLLRVAVARGGDGHKIRAHPPAFHDLVGNALLGELEVAFGLFKRRIDDGVFDGYRWHFFYPVKTNIPLAPESKSPQDYFNYMPI